jgi:hypothetical protein
MTRPRAGSLACTLAIAVAAAAQDPGAPPAPPPQARPQAPSPQGPLYELPHNLLSSVENGDFREDFVYGGFRFRWPTLGIEILGRNALLLSDREAVREQLGDRRGDGPPRRDIEPPVPARELTPAVLHDRVQRMLSAFGRQDQAPPPPPAAYEALRYLYFEGGIVIVRDGVEVARCDRRVVEDCELRYTARTPQGQTQQIVVRGPRLEKQGARWVGRDLSVTSCDAGTPHAAVASGELELIERDGQFEIRSRGNALQIQGTSVLPLPDAHFFSGEQTAIPVHGGGGGYSSSEGGRAHVDIGMPMNDVGGSIHEWLTGRPAHEFRGDWNVGLGWIDRRGEPFDGALHYRVPGLYEGSVDGFYMWDQGPNIREITNDLDGSLIDDNRRTLVRTQNRVLLGDETHLDLVAFHAGDPAVYSEFYRGDYHDKELPETSVYLHHASDNVLVTLGGRFQTDSFAYRDNRALAPFFVEELPVATLHWLAQPIATTPWDTPIVLDASTEVGQRRRAISDHAPAGIESDRTLRIDQLAELSAPLLLGPIELRPYGSARYTYYDAAADGDPADRAAFEAGVRAGTRLSRTWHWTDDAGNDQGLRHVIAPLVTFADRFHVSGDPAQFRQFDDQDALTEQNLVRFELRNLLQRMEGTGKSAAPHDIVLADVAQDVWPDADRDNKGEELGLFYYDLLVRSEPTWWSLQTLSFGVYGDHDWQNGLRTFDSEVQFGKVLGIDWSLDYRRDAVVDAAAGIGAHAALLGHWDVQGSISYDFERDEVQHYYAGLRRDDHDWSLLVGISFDPFEDVVSFRFQFEPHLFGKPARREREWFGPMPGAYAKP